MAKQIITNLIDDIDGSEAKETLAFGLDGSNYEIDLNDKHAARLRKALEPYLSNGRRQHATSAFRPARGVASAVKAERAEELGRIRIWARENGHEVSDRGRIAESIVDAYKGRMFSA